MPKLNSSEVRLDLGASGPVSQSGGQRARRDPDDAFVILILGDFGGRRTTEVSERRPVQLDRDNFDDVLSRMDVRANFPLGSRGASVSLHFRELVDFEPDRIYERCDLFRSLPNSRPTPAPQQIAQPPAASRADLSALAGGSLLDSIVDVSESHRPRPKDQLQSMVEKIVAPHVMRKEDDVTPASTGNAAILMRAILHHPAFQALEAAWRAVWKLVRDLDTDAQLKLYLLDVTKAELAQDQGSLAPIGSRREGWDVIAGNYVFDRTSADIVLLTKLGAAAHSAGAPFFAESTPPDDDDADNQEWQALRRSAQARWVGLAVPRFLLRPPYTSASYAVESFHFEELTAPPDHSHYLWGNPAFACASLLGQSFNKYGWDLRPGMIQQIGHLPLHTYTVDGEIYAQPCAEILMTERQADYILDHGLMPLASIKGTDSIRLVRFQSIAEPLAPLSGRWNVG